jgi:hypothetical protein
VSDAPVTEHEAWLIERYMGSIDLFLDLLDRYVATVMRGEQSPELRGQLRRAMATWGELVINRADGRTAGMLVDMYKRLEAIEADGHERTRLLQELNAKVDERLPPRPPREVLA